MPLYTMTLKSSNQGGKGTLEMICTHGRAFVLKRPKTYSESGKLMLLIAQTAYLLNSKIKTNDKAC